MQFSSQGTAAQAEENLQYVAAREPHLLQVLALSMAQARGPVERMDASFTSLEALWAWLVDFVEEGCPGLLDSLHLLEEGGERAGTGLEDASSNGAWVLGEGVNYYVRAIWQRFAPPAPWAIYKTPGAARVRDAEHYDCGILVNGTWKRADYGTAFIGLLLSGQPFARKPGALSRALLLTEGWSELPAMGTGPSVLAPLLDARLGPMPAAARVPPARVGGTPLPNETPAESAVGEPVTLWRGPFDALDEPSLAGALDAERVAGVLGDLGFVDGDGAPPTASALREATGDGMELCVPSMDAVAAVIASDGAVRLVHVEPVEISRAGWRRVRAALKKLAKAEGARLVADSQME